MYATVQKISSSHRLEPSEALEQIRLRRVVGDGELLVSLWQSEPAGEAYEVQGDRRGEEDGDSRPAVASVLTFDGPMSAAVKAAAERAGMERIAPVLFRQPGTVRGLFLWQPERRSQIVITFATSMERLEANGRQVGSMPLLPGEDVALLPGPDHVELFRVQS